MKLIDCRARLPPSSSNAKVYREKKLHQIGLPNQGAEQQILAPDDQYTITG
jgi:hypothetical protein